MARPKKALPDSRLHEASGRAIVTVNGRLLLPRQARIQSLYERYMLALKAHGTIPPHVVRGEEKPSQDADANACNVEQLDELWQHVEGEGRYLKNGKPTS